MSRILLVDDEQDLVWALKKHFDGQGFETDTALDGVEALSIINLRRPDLIVLDILMPCLDGLTLCRKLRHDEDTADIPILFLTTRDTVEERIDGLRVGGDDYLTKPFDVRELEARVQALLRRTPQPTRKAAASLDVLRCGPLTVDLQKRQAIINDNTVQLTVAEFDLLRFLMGHPGQVFSSEELLQKVWGYTSATADTGLVRWHVKNLRAKLEADPLRPVIIRTIPRQGYFFADSAAA